MSTSNIDNPINHLSHIKYPESSSKEPPYQLTLQHFPSTPTQSSSFSQFTSSPHTRSTLSQTPSLQSPSQSHTSPFQTNTPHSPGRQTKSNNVVVICSPPLLKTGGRGTNFSNNSLKQLCRSWLAVSEDPVFGNDQKGSTFWARIAADHNKRVSPGEVRTVKSLESRWATLNRSMARFAGYVEQIRGLWETGKGPDDIVMDALALYKQEVGSDFKDVESYKILQSAPKWQLNPVYYEFCSETSNDAAGDLAINNLHTDAEPKESRLLELEELPQLNRPSGNKKAKRQKASNVEDVSPQMLANSTAVANSTRILAEQGSHQSATLQRMLEHTILMSDTRHLDPQARADIEAEKAFIIRKNLSRRAAME